MPDKINTLSIKVVSHQQDCQYSAGDTLLESLESAKINVQYHCREGYCGACRTKLIEGEIEYTTAPLAFVDDDEILPCCCHPTTNLKINIE